MDFSFMTWVIIIAGLILIIGLTIIWTRAFKEVKTEDKMKAEPDLWADVKAEFHTLVLTLFYKAKSATFWIAVILIVVGLERGGLEGMLMAMLSALGYTSKEAYQNVRFGQMKANATKPDTTIAPVAPQINEKQSTAIDKQTTTIPPDKQAQKKPAVPWKPIPNTTPEFTDLDKELMSEELMSAIAEWYTKPISHRPTLPEIPPPGADVLPYAWDKAMEQRTNQAAGIITEEAWDKIFDPMELNRVTQLRGKNCDWRLWDRIQDHWRVAFNRWIDYGMALWLYYDRQVNKPPEPRPQPDW